MASRRVVEIHLSIHPRLIRVTPLFQESHQIKIIYKQHIQSCRGHIIRKISCLRGVSRRVLNAFSPSLVKVRCLPDRERLVGTSTTPRRWGLLLSHQIYLL